MSNTDRQNLYIKNVIRDLNIDLESVINNSASASGWCHLHKETLYLALEVKSLRKEIAKLKKSQLKVVNDE